MTNTNPGPGKYIVNNNYNETNKSVKIGTNPRKNDWEGKKPQLYPGPGNYSYVQTISSSNSTKFPTTKRITITLDDSMKDCGPGKYNPNTSSFGKGSKFTIKGKLNYENQASSPGPCAYEIKTLLNTSSGKKSKFCTSKRKELFQNKPISPGPANYHVNEKKSKLAYGFGKEKRLDILKPKTPGPGQYSVNENLVGQLPSYLIPNEERKLNKS